VSRRDDARPYPTLTFRQRETFRQAVIRNLLDCRLSRGVIWFNKLVRSGALRIEHVQQAREALRSCERIQKKLTRRKAEGVHLRKYFSPTSEISRQRHLICA